jgi:hypothetical protein
LYSRACDAQLEQAPRLKLNYLLCRSDFADLQIVGFVQAPTYVRRTPAFPYWFVRATFAVAHIISMSKDSTRFTKTDLPRKQLPTGKSARTGSHLSTGSFRRRLTEQEMMELEALEMSIHADPEERSVSYFEWQARSTRPASAPEPAPRVGPIKRMFFRLTGRG